MCCRADKEALVVIRPMNFVSATMRRPVTITVAILTAQKRAMTQFAKLSMRKR